MNSKITKLLAEKEKNSEKIAKLSTRNEEIDSQVMEAARQSGPLPVLADGEEEPEHD